ncbi:hypothetical protein KY313_01600 [Candidatus Woesearchaeota archaeon]|nr:hypothetical protein [Candidatus Woesearchaeota archaeon]
MAEMELIIEQVRLTYEGLFKATDLYKLIDNWLRTHGYDKRELKSIEKITPSGKYIEVESLPWKKQTEYVKNDIKIRMQLSDVTEVEVEQNGVTVKLNKGKVHFVFDGYLTTDYEQRWEQKPSFIFIRALFDKFFYKTYMDRWKANMIKDVNDLHDTIKSFLNLYRYQK